MKLSAALAIVFSFCFAIAHSFSQNTVEEWQQRTVVEYPEIGVKDSDMNQKYVAKIKQLQQANPAFFRDPKWPYTLAEQISKAPIIPGVEAVTPPVTNATPPSRQPQYSEQPAYTRPTNPYVRGQSSGGIEQETFIAAPEVGVKATKGRIVETEGVVSRCFQRVLGDADKFYIKIEPDIVVEISNSSFATRSGHIFSQFMDSSNFTNFTAKVESGVINLYGQRYAAASGYYGYYRRVAAPQQIKIAEILKKGQKISVKGRYDGDWAGGVEKGKILLDATILKVE